MLTFTVIVDYTCRRNGKRYRWDGEFDTREEAERQGENFADRVQGEGRLYSGGTLLAISNLGFPFEAPPKPLLMKRAARFIPGANSVR